MQTSPAYHVIGAIHEGVSTRIYRAIRIADQRPVILKTCKSDHPPLNDIVRLRREFEIMSSLDLPGVVTIYDMEQTNYGLALIMEDFDGVSLDQLLASPLDLDTFLHIALNLAETLADPPAHDHSQGCEASKCYRQHAERRSKADRLWHRLAPAA